MPFSQPRVVWVGTWPGDTTSEWWGLRRAMDSVVLWLPRLQCAWTQLDGEKRGKQLELICENWLKRRAEKPGADELDAKGLSCLRYRSWLEAKPPPYGP